MEDKVVSFKEAAGKRIIFTHNDLDGMGCAILYQKAFPDCTIVYCDNNTVEEDLQYVAQQTLPPNTHIMISDLNVTPQTAEKLLAAPGVVELEIVDHHISASPLRVYPWALIDTSYCATKLLFNLLNTNFTLDDYKDFVELVDNWDRWGGGKGPSEKAREIATLLEAIGKGPFVNRFSLTSSIILTESEIVLLDIHQRRKEEYFAESLKILELQTDGSDYPFGIVYADQYLSELGNFLLVHRPDIEYIIMIDTRRAKVHLRSRDTVDVSKIAVLCGGGGHPKAAGFPLLSNAPTKLLFRCTEDDCNMLRTLREENDALNNKLILARQSFDQLKRKALKKK
jgi:uncharacterized protein